MFAKQKNDTSLKQQHTINIITGFFLMLIYFNTKAETSDLLPPARVFQTQVSNTCGTRIYRFTVSMVSGATGYAWTIPTSVGGVQGVLLDSGNLINSRVIRLKISSNTAALPTDSIYVRAYTATSTSINKGFRLTVTQLSAPPTPESITETPVVLNECNGRIFRYSAPSLPFGSSTIGSAEGYAWTLPGGNLGSSCVLDSGVLTGRDARTIRIRYLNNQASNNDTLKLYYTSGCGSSTSKAAPLSYPALTGCNVPVLVNKEFLGRPTNNSVTLKVFFSADAEVSVQYGKNSGAYNRQTAWTLFPANEPATIQIPGLKADTRYYYRLLYRTPGSTGFETRPEYSFHTQRLPGSTFSFVLEADPHLDFASDTALYRVCLNNQLTDNPDFMIDLGDNIFTEKMESRITGLVPRDTVTYRCNLLRNYYEVLSHSVPTYLTLGNHEGELGFYNDGTPNNMAVWDAVDRIKYFLNPVPDNFYTGDTSYTNYIGQRQSYYAWTWGDALFVILDPYWNTRVKPLGDNGWAMSLGKEQYDWLKKTLEMNNSKFKFVFCHQLVGGFDASGRGGTEAADYFEWGGKSINGVDSFAYYRPGWYKPIKELLKEHHVNIFFHGHDHFYARQEKDCMIYQETPKPNFSTGKTSNIIPTANDKGYYEGLILDNSGHLRVTVSPEGVQVDYVRAYLPSNESSTRHNKDISATYYIGAVNCYDSSTFKSLQNKIIPESNVTPVLWNSNYGVEDIAYPNPFTAETKIQFNIEKKQRLHFVIYNNMGVIVKKWDYNNLLSEGKYTVIWDGKNSSGTLLPSGTYYYTLIGDEGMRKNGEIVLVR